MKKGKFTNLSTEQLEKNKKSITVISIILAGMLLLLFGLSLYNTFTKGFTALLVVPIALLPILILNYSNLKEIEKELKLRKNN